VLFYSNWKEMSSLLIFIMRCCVPETMRQEACLDISEYTKNMSKYNLRATAVVRPFLSNYNTHFILTHTKEMICSATSLSNGTMNFFIVFLTGFTVVILLCHNIYIYIYIYECAT